MTDIRSMQKAFGARSLRQRIFSTLRFWPWLVWLACGGLALLALYKSQSQRSKFPGLVMADTHTVSSLRTAKVARMLFAPGDLVEAGAILAQLDTTELNAKLKVARKELEYLQARGSDVPLEMLRRQNKLPRQAGRSSNLATLDLFSGDQLQEVEARIQLKQSRLAMLELERETMQFTAPFGGRVQEVFVSEGQVVKVGQPLLTVVRTDKPYVIAYISKSAANSVQPGDEAIIKEASQSYRGRVSSLSPVLEPVPEPFAVARPITQEYAQKVFIGELTGKPTAIGDTVSVAFVKGKSAAKDAGATAEALPQRLQPKPIILPNELAKQTPLEASGVVWNSLLNSYLVISDDVGYKQKGLPWLFAMSEKGVLQSQPLIMSKVKKVRDLEGITSDGNRAIYLITSQSKTRKGKQKSSRQLLIRAMLDKEGITATHTVNFLGALKKRFKSKALNKLGIKKLDKLDIEGLSFYNDVLYLGLKSPKTKAGEIIIWRITDLSKFLRSKKLSKGQLSLWKKLKLPNSSAQLADFFLYDAETIFVLTTEPSGKSQLWEVTGSQVVEKSSFANLQAEGVALAKDGKQLIIVFDEDKAQPKWTMVDI